MSYSEWSETRRPVIAMAFQLCSRKSHSEHIKYWITVSMLIYWVKTNTLNKKTESVSDTSNKVGSWSAGILRLDQEVYGDVS